MSSVPSRGASSSSPSLTMVERSRSGSTASLAASALSHRCSRKLTSKATGTSSLRASSAMRCVAERTGSRIRGMLPKFTKDAPETRSSATSSGESSSSAAGLDR